MQVLNLVFFFLGTMVVIILGLGGDFSASVMLNVPYIAICPIILLTYLMGMAQGFCGAIQEDKCCMIANTVLTTITAFFLVVLLLVSAAILGTVKDELQKHCEKKPTSFEFIYLDSYDQNILKKGSAKHFCGPDCLCHLPTTPIFTH